MSYICSLLYDANSEESLSTTVCLDILLTFCGQRFASSRSSSSYGLDLRDAIAWDVLTNRLRSWIRLQKVTSGSRLTNQHYLAVCFLGRYRMGRISQSPMALGYASNTLGREFCSAVCVFDSASRFATRQSSSLPLDSWVAIEWDALANQLLPTDLLLGCVSNSVKTRITSFAQTC